MAKPCSCVRALVRRLASEFSEEAQPFSSCRCVLTCSVWAVLYMKLVKKEEEEEACCVQLLMIRQHVQLIPVLLVVPCVCVCVSVCLCVSVCVCVCVPVCVPFV